jgi:hypothetical protein
MKNRLAPETKRTKKTGRALLAGKSAVDQCAQRPDMKTENSAANQIGHQRKISDHRKQ